MIIKAKCVFLHGRQRFEAGQLYDVPEGPGYYFCASGWAEDQAGVAPTGDASGGTVALKIDNVALGHDAPTVEG